MKIIDLLNKIANGEIPKKIKFDNRLYTFDEKKYNYYENETCSINWDYVSLRCLNEKVEILEEENKIPEKLPEWATSREDKEYTNDEYHCLVVARKVDEIIDYLKSKGD